MKKYLCILAAVALLAACEQKTETVAPASPAASPESTTSTTTTTTTESPAPTP